VGAGYGLLLFALSAKKDWSELQPEEEF